MIILALSLTLGAVSAEETVGDVAPADDGVVAATSEDVAADSTDDGDVGAAAGGEETATAVSTTPSADLMVDTEVLGQEGDIVTWGVLVYNYGPDVAENTMVYDVISDNLVAVDYLASQGVYDLDLGFWDVGNLPAGESAVMYLYTAVLDYGPYFNEVMAVSDTPDPDLSNNYDIAFFGYDDESDSASASAAEQTLPETGNPLVLALMALMVVGVGGLRRRL